MAKKSLQLKPGLWDQFQMLSLLTQNVTQASRIFKLLKNQFLLPENGAQRSLTWFL